MNRYRAFIYLKTRAAPNYMVLEFEGPNDENAIEYARRICKHKQSGTGFLLQKRVWWWLWTLIAKEQMK